MQPTAYLSELAQTSFHALSPELAQSGGDETSHGFWYTLPSSVDQAKLDHLQLLIKFNWEHISRPCEYIN